jgi:uncharacterized membrane protein
MKEFLLSHFSNNFRRIITRKLLFSLSVIIVLRFKVLTALKILPSLVKNVNLLFEPLKRKISQLNQKILIPAAQQIYEISVTKGNVLMLFRPIILLCEDHVKLKKRFERKGIVTVCNGIWCVYLPLCFEGFMFLTSY